MPGPSPAEKVDLAVPSAQPEVLTELAAQLFHEEVADLEAQASVTAFIDVIATRRVKERLRNLARTK